MYQKAILRFHTVSNVTYTDETNKTVIVFFTNLMNKFFIFLIHLLHSSTCFEQYYAHPQEVKLYYYSIWYRHSDCSVHRLNCVLNSHLKRVMIPDAVLIKFDILRMSIIVLETRSGM